MGADCKVQNNKYVSMVRQIDIILSNKEEGVINKDHKFAVKELDKLNENFNDKLKPPFVIDLTDYDYKFATAIGIFGLIAIIGLALF